MKVRELMARLARLDPELIVVIPQDRSGDLCPIQRVGVDTVCTSDSGLTLAYGDEEGATQVVMLFDSDLDGGRQVT